MEDWAEIRAAAPAEKMPIKAIARRLGVSRNAVRRALAKDSPPRYQRGRDPAGLRRPPGGGFPATGGHLPDPGRAGFLGGSGVTYRAPVRGRPAVWRLHVGGGSLLAAPHHRVSMPVGIPHDNDPVEPLRPLRGLWTMAGSERWRASSSAGLRGTRSVAGEGAAPVRSASAAGPGGDDWAWVWDDQFWPG